MCNLLYNNSLQENLEIKKEGLQEQIIPLKVGLFIFKKALTVVLECLQAEAFYQKTTQDYQIVCR